ncbi:MAG: hypothetical protein B6U89_00090 [Desulfurococcales archaeon ex4484_58]|nr:MAG: hypothetical protein B6U89_00090 [Desulfurococcales archaeon ex4484_58]
MLSDIIYLIIAIISFSLLIYVFKPLIKRYFFKLKLENEFLDFLSILLTLEASGLRLDNVFEEAFNRRLVLPSSYNVLARDYIFLSKINPDPYTCLRKLADRIPSDRVREFFRGYSEVLISTNDTLRYVESFLRDEFNSLKNRINSYIGFLDNLFEAYMILLLGIVVYSILPFTFFPPYLVLFFIIGLSIASFLVALKLLSLAMVTYDNIVFTATLALLAGSPVIVLLGDMFWVVHLIIVLLIGLVLLFMTRYIVSVENKFIILLEDLYSETRQGVSIDYALIRVGDRYGDPVSRIVDLLKLGLKPIEIVKSLKLPVLSSRVLSLTLAPIEYSRGGGGYLGYVLGIVEGIKGLRRTLEERGRIYYLYVLFLLIVVYVMYRLFSRVDGSMFMFNVDGLFIKNIAYISLFESIVIAGVVSRGYWFRSMVGYLLLLLSSIMIFFFF